ncbi:MAG: hypothetical protein Kow0090_10320 [Myxococcota bacterium]
MNKKRSDSEKPREEVGVIAELNAIAGGSLGYLDKVEAAQEFIRRIPIEERSALMLHFTREPIRSREIARRIARREIYNLVLLKPHRRAKENGEFRATIQPFGDEPARSYALKPSEPTTVEARDAFTLFTQYEGYLGEWGEE